MIHDTLLYLDFWIYFMGEVFHDSSWSSLWTQSANWWATGIGLLLRRYSFTLWQFFSGNHSIFFFIRKTSEVVKEII